MKKYADMTIKEVIKKLAKRLAKYPPSKSNSIIKFMKASDLFNKNYDPSNYKYTWTLKSYKDEI